MNNRISLNATGLSRQSAKSYKAVQQKSNADLSKTLRQLNTEHKASISKILHEEYTLKNVHHALKTAGLFTKRKRSESLPDNFGEYEFNGESEMDCESESIGVNSSELTDQDEGFYSGSKAERLKPCMGSYKKHPACHLPIILEETNRSVHSYCPSKSVRTDYTLPPLLDPKSAKLSRGSDERSFVKPSGRARQRSSTLSIPVESMSLDSYGRHITRRRSYMGDYRSVNGSGRGFTDDGFEGRSKDDTGATKSLESWGGDMRNCRYLRRTNSSPDVLDPEFLFRD